MTIYLNRYKIILQLSYILETRSRGDLMLVENTKGNRDLKRVTASMAIENMFFSESFIKEMIKVSNGEKTTEELRREIIKKYAR